MKICFHSFNLLGRQDHTTLISIVPYPTIYYLFEKITFGLSKDHSWATCSSRHCKRPLYPFFRGKIQQLIRWFFTNTSYILHDGDVRYCIHPLSGQYRSNPSYLLQYPTANALDEKINRMSIIQITQLLQQLVDRVKSRSFNRPL